MLIKLRFDFENVRIVMVPVILSRAIGHLLSRLDTCIVFPIELKLRIERQGGRPSCRGTSHRVYCQGSDEARESKLKHGSPDLLHHTCVWGALFWPRYFLPVMFLATHNKVVTQRISSRIPYSIARQTDSRISDR